MKLRVKKRDGFWKTYFVYNENTPQEFEVYMDKYTDWEEAIAVAIYIAGMDL